MTIHKLCKHYITGSVSFAPYLFRVIEWHRACDNVSP